MFVAERKLLEELEEAKDMRQSTEKEREDLVKKAKTLQNKTQNRRNHGNCDLAGSAPNCFP